MSYTDERLSVEFVQYLAAGIAVIAVEDVRGAVGVTQEEQVGFVPDIGQGDAMEALKLIKNVVRNREDRRTRCIALARDCFSSRTLAAQPSSLYPTARKAG